MNNYQATNHVLPTATDCNRLQPTAAERKAPGATNAAGDLLALMEDDDAAADDDGDDD